MPASYVIVGFLVVQRLAELGFARRNRRALLARGAVEVGQGHYPATRIDTDLDHLTPCDPRPLGDDVLDPTLAEIVGAEETHDALYWVERTARRGREIRERAIARLVSRGILREPGDDTFLSLTPEVAHARRYPSTKGAATEHVKLRIMRVLFSDDIPDPADIVIISLVDAGDIWRQLLTAEELARARKRIEIVSRLDLIGRAVATLVRIVRPTARAARDRAAGLPLARGLPLVGSTLSVARDPRTFFVQEYLRVGPVFKVRTLTRNFVAMAGLEANLFVSRSERMHLHTSDMWDPALRERAQAEADALFAGGTPDAAQVRELDVLYRIMLEALRMYTPVPGIQRKVTTSFDFAGHRIPAGEDLFLAFFVTHDLPEHFPDPRRFDMDRYLPGRDEHKQPGVFVPFGVGEHHCAGRGFAEAQLPLIVATLLHEVDMELVPPTYELKTDRWVLFPSFVPDKRFRFRVRSRRD